MVKYTSNGTIVEAVNNTPSTRANIVIPDHLNTALDKRHDREMIRCLVENGFITIDQLETRILKYQAPIPYPDLDRKTAQEVLAQEATGI